MNIRSKEILTASLMLLLALVPHIVSVAADSDLWWQLKIGCDMLVSGEFLFEDPYSYASGSKQWVNHEWLPQLLWAKAYLSLGESGLLLVRGIILAALIAVLFFHHQFTTRELILPGIVTALLSVPLLSFFANLRPRIVTFLFLALLLLIFEIYRVRKTRLIALLPVVFLIWCNSHGGFLLGYGVMGFGVISLLLWSDGTKRSLPAAEKRELISFSLISLLAIFCTPYGADLPSFVVAELGTGHPHITEWEPINLSQSATFLFIALIPILAAFFGDGFRHSTALFAFVATGVLTARYSRFLPLFFISSAVLLFASLPGVAQRFQWISLQPGRLWRLGAFLILIPIGGWGAFLISSGAAGITVDNNRYPIKAVEFLQQLDRPARLILPFDWGGYAIWHLHPPFKVGIDGRYASVYDESYVNAQIEGYRAGDLDGFFGGYNADYALVPTESNIYEALKDADYTRVYSDPVAAVYALKKEIQGGG